jgi:hypothetical protein
MKIITTTTLLLLVLTACVYAEQQKKRGDRRGEDAAAQSEALNRFDQILEEEKQKKGQWPNAPSPPEAAGVEMLDDQTKAQYLIATREYYGYRVSGYQHRREVFRWQFYSSKIIFYVVIFLVLSGVYFSGIQFHRPLSRRRPNGFAEQNEMTKAVSVERSEVTEVVASVKGIKVSSPILGVIILVISLLFFYLYLVFVYPINEVL